MKRLIPWLVLASLACQLSQLSPASSPTSNSPQVISSASVASPTLGVSTLPTLTPVPLEPTVTFSPTLAPYEQYTIDYLRRRTYGGGKIEIVETMEEKDSFTRYFIRYPSDGLNIYGFANVPKGNGPFPIIIAIHGFVDPAAYETVDYTAPALDGLAQAGYIVFHPNMRGYAPSDPGDNLFRVGMAVDVLNLVALLKAGSAPSELLTKASLGIIGLWGHSMGGDIILRVLTVSSDIKAAVLYASMSGDEIKNARLLALTSSDPIFQTELSISPAIVERISPLYYYKNITAPIQLHHGTADRTVPIADAQETCSALTAAGVQVQCLYYPDEDHTFRRRVISQFGEAVLGFYKTYLSP